MDLAEKLNQHHSPGNRFSYYPLSSKWSEVAGEDKMEIVPDASGFGLYFHIPFCRDICTYCGCNIKISKKEDEHLNYTEALVRELMLRTQHWSEDIPLKSIHLGGGTPNTLSERSYDLLVDHLQKFIGPQTQSGQMEADPRYFDERQAQIARELKIERISFGVQDFNSQILSNVNRRQDPDDIKRSKEAMLENQAMGIDLLWGLPKQSIESIQSWYGHIKDLAPDWISYYPLAKVPWLESIQQAYGDFTLPTKEEKYRLYQAGIEIFEELGYVNLGMGHFIKANGNIIQDGPIYRKVSGLFTRPTSTLVGLGVSAISESKSHLSQNDKIIDRYIHTVLKKNELPTMKKHHKSSSEIEMNLFVESVFSHNQIPTKYLEKLGDYLSSEWVETNGEITELGKHFKKNIMQLGEKFLLKQALF